MKTIFAIIFKIAFFLAAYFFSNALFMIAITSIVYFAVMPVAKYLDAKIAELKSI